MFKNNHRHQATIAGLQWATEYQIHDTFIAYDFCYELYAVSSKKWKNEVTDDIRAHNDSQSQLSEKLFHVVVQKVLFDGRPPRDFFNTREGHGFEQHIRCGIPMNDFSKCIELVEFDDKSEKYWKP